ncbi:ATP-binding protein [Cohnella sp.]|uniref:sensor histidine kinase n=1 Tax=Cohnella sp. TaxID=1883426 RepID=UPI00356B247C
MSRILLILAALLLIIGLFQYVFMERFLYQNKAEGIQRQIQSVPGEIWERVNPNMRRGLVNSFIFFPSSSVAYINKEGQLIALSSAASPPGSESLVESVPRLHEEAYIEALKKPRRKQAAHIIYNDPVNGEQLVVLQAVKSFNGTPGVVQVSTSTKPLKGELYRQLTLFLGLAFAALIGGLLTFLPAIRKTLIPLSRMVATVEQIDSGKLNERLSEKEQLLEINRLAHSFNRMLERLETSFHAELEAKEQMRRFVADASHELRTPLTSIHGFLEVLLRGAATDPEQLDKALKSMYGESERINKLVYDLLQLAKLDRAPEVHWAECDLAAIVKEMEPQLLVLAQDREVSMELSSGIPQRLDLDKMKQVLLNLFQNAVKHTHPLQGKIHIAVRNINTGVELTLKDNGTGIASEHLPHLFDRFYRIESSRARKYGGAGLGLSISRSLVELHGGTLTAQSELGKGSTFRVFIPTQLFDR